MSTKTFVGIDPGSSGGIAVIDQYPSGPDVVTAHAMPDSENGVWDLFLPLIGQDVRAVIEKVWGHVGGPGNPGSAMFQFGASYGSLRMALVAACLSFEAVPAPTWQKSLGIPKRGRDEAKGPWKNRLKARAQELFPRLNVTLSTADALLIAEFCRRRHVGAPNEVR